MTSSLILADCGILLLSKQRRQEEDDVLMVLPNAIIWICLIPELTCTVLTELTLSHGQDVKIQSQAPTTQMIHLVDMRSRRERGKEKKMTGRKLFTIRRSAVDGFHLIYAALANDLLEGYYVNIFYLSIYFLRKLYMTELFCGIFGL